MAHIPGNVLKQAPVVVHRVLCIDVKPIWVVFEHLVYETAVFICLGQCFLDGCKHMILPNFAQSQVWEEIDVYPVAFIIDATARNHAMEVHVEFEVFTESMQGTGYPDFYPDSMKMILEDVFNYDKDLLGCHLNEIAVCFHQRPYLIWQGEDNVPVRNPEEMAADPLCPILSQPPATGRAEAAVATVVDDFLLATFGTEKRGVSLAWVVAEEHCLYGIALVLGKRTLICIEEINKNVVFQERFLVFDTYVVFPGDNL